MSRNLPRPSIDGFVLKRRTTGDATLRPQLSSRNILDNKTMQQPSDMLPRPVSIQSQGGLTRTDIDESLKAIDEPSVAKKKDKKSKKDKQKGHRSWYKRKPIIVSFVVLLLLFGGGGYFLSKIIAVSGRVFNGGTVLDLFGGGTKLKQDTNGWTNVLVFGTSEDDPGHNGAYLTDSIMVVSVNQDKKAAAMTSMPRDMWVTYDTPCDFGYQGKINVVYECAGAKNGNLQDIDPAKGAAALQEKVGEVFGLDVQYYVKVDYSVVRDITNALGGVTVTIESDNPNGIYDSNMGTMVKFKNGPVTIKGEQALAFVRARGDGYGSYGFNGNFTRELDQQKMIVAIRDKALSTGTLTNPIAINDMLDSLGNNIKTNFSTGEVKTLAMLGKDVDGDKVVHVDLNDNDKRVVTTGMYNAQSIVRPVAGISDYTEIQEYILAKMNGGSLETEGATTEVLNGSGKVGAASAEQTKLTQAGILNISTGNTTYKPTKAIEWYDLSNGKMPKTLEKLTSILGVKPKGTMLPTGVQSNANFVITLGSE